MDNNIQGIGDAIVSVLETLFGFHIPFEHFSRKDNDLLHVNRSTAEAYNRVRYHLCKRFYIKCHYPIIDKKKKFTKLFKEADSMVDHLLFNTTYNVLINIPRKSIVEKDISDHLVKKVSVKAEKYHNTMESNNMEAEDSWEHKNKLINNKDFQKATIAKAKNFYDSFNYTRNKKLKLENTSSYEEFVITKRLSVSTNIVENFIERLLNNVGLGSRVNLQLADVEVCFGYIFNPIIYSRLLSKETKNKIDKTMIYLDPIFYMNVKHFWLELQIGANPISGMDDYIQFDVPLIRIERELENITNSEKVLPKSYKLALGYDNKQNEKFLEKHARESEIESNIYYTNRAESKSRKEEWLNDKDLFLEKLYEKYFKENPVDLEDYWLFENEKKPEYIPFKFIRSEEETEQLRKTIPKPKSLSAEENESAGFRKMYLFCRLNNLNNTQSLIWIQNQLNKVKGKFKFTKKPVKVPVKDLQKEITKAIYFLKNLKDSKIEEKKKEIYEKNKDGPDIDDIKIQEVKVVSTAKNHFEERRNKFYKLRWKVGYDFKKKFFKQEENFNDLLQEHLEIMSASSEETLQNNYDVKYLQATYRFQKRMAFNVICSGMLRYKNEEMPTYLMDDLLWLGHSKGFIAKPKTVNMNYVPKIRYSKTIRKLLSNNIHFDRID